MNGHHPQRYLPSFAAAVLSLASALPGIAGADSLTAQAAQPTFPAQPPAAPTILQPATSQPGSSSDGTAPLSARHSLTPAPGPVATTETVAITQINPINKGAGPGPASLARELGQRDSATATLQRHCRQPITAHLLDQHSPPDVQYAARMALHAPAAAPLAIRHVLLSCGQDIYSEAWNLYLPERLTPQSRQLLQDGHTPFGRAVGEPNFLRLRLGSRLTALPPGIVLENRAILRRRHDGEGLAYLIERYTQASLNQAMMMKQQH